MQSMVRIKQQHIQHFVLVLSKFFCVTQLKTVPKLHIQETLACTAAEAESEEGGLWETFQPLQYTSHLTWGVGLS